MKRRPGVKAILSRVWIGVLIWIAFGIVFAAGVKISGIVGPTCIGDAASVEEICRPCTFFHSAFGLLGFSDCPIPGLGVLTQLFVLIPWAILVLLMISGIIWLAPIGLVASVLALRRTFNRGAALLHRGLITFILTSGIVWLALYW